MRSVTLFAGAVALSLASAAKADAQTEPVEPDWVGVWEGKIGKDQVIACLDTSVYSGGRGAFYRSGEFTLQRLTLDNESGVWNSKNRADEAGGTWTITDASADTITGQWEKDGETQQIELRAMDWQDPELPALPCEAAAFMKPRLEGGEVVPSSADIGWQSFIAHEYRSPKHLDVAVRAFSLNGNQPGDSAINEALDGYIPKGDVSDDWAQCLSGSIAMSGMDGYFEREVAPILLSSDFVSVRIASSTYCGGAHPNHNVRHRLFDRQSGKEIALENWFKSSAFSPQPYDLWNISDAFRKHIIILWVVSDAEADPECGSFIRDNQYWDLALGQDGITFTPDLPHVATACENPIAVKWDDLEKWMSAAGQAGKARVVRGKN